MAELLGTHSYSLDPKGRVSLPARFRAAFDEGLWLTVGQDRCLYCFPRAEWERRSREVGAFALSDKDGRAFSRLFFSAADEVRLDAQGASRSRSACGTLSGSTRKWSCSVSANGSRSGTEPSSSGTETPMRTRMRTATSSPEEHGRSGGSPDSTGHHGRRRIGMQTKLSTEVRQSLSLLGMTALTLLASIGLGVLAGQIG